MFLTGWWYITRWSLESNAAAVTIRQPKPSYLLTSGKPTTKQNSTHTSRVSSIRLLQDVVHPHLFVAFPTTTTKKMSVLVPNNTQYCGWATSGTTLKQWDTIASWKSQGNQQKPGSPRNAFRNHPQYLPSHPGRTSANPFEHSSFHAKKPLSN